MDWTWFPVFFVIWWLVDTMCDTYKEDRQAQRDHDLRMASLKAQEIGRRMYKIRNADLTKFGRIDPKDKHE